jgi:hypothetical protein
MATSTPEKATQPAVEAVPTMKDLEGVRYVGTADIRIITTAEGEDLVWNADNGFFVPKADLNAATRDFLATQSDFSIE